MSILHAITLAGSLVSNPIEVPPEVMPAFATYTHCVDDDFRQRMLSVHNLDEARLAWSSSVRACRDVRAQQLERALAVRVDRRIYGDRANSNAIVHTAFDRFDTEFNMEWNDGPASPNAERQADH